MQYIIETMNATKKTNKIILQPIFSPVDLNRHLSGMAPRAQKLMIESQKWLFQSEHYRSSTPLFSH